jgi:hypothetical protein
MEENKTINLYFADWFDPTNIAHIEAYEYLMNNAHWPKGFKPDNVIMGSHWQVELAFKMAALWVTHMKHLHSNNTPA